MTKKQSTLGLYKDFVLAKQFENTLWVQQDNTTSAEEWSCEKVSKWVTTIKCMPYDVGSALVRNDVNGAALLVTGREELKEIGVTKAGTLALLLKEIKNL